MACDLLKKIAVVSGCKNTTSAAMVHCLRQKTEEELLETTLKLVSEVGWPVPVLPNLVLYLRLLHLISSAVLEKLFRAFSCLLTTVSAFCIIEIVSLSYNEKPSVVFFHYQVSLGWCRSYLNYKLLPTFSCFQRLLLQIQRQLPAWPFLIFHISIPPPNSLKTAHWSSIHIS